MGGWEKIAPKKTEEWCQLLAKASLYIFFSRPQEDRNRSAILLWS